jgi:NADH-quinone oxidoreductase subunit J
MNLADCVFLLFAAITVAGALFAVTLRNVFYNALSLIACLFGVAGLFVFLNSEFLAVMEVIIYIGAISVAIIFSIMLTRDLSGKDLSDSPAQLVRAALGAGLLFTAVSCAICMTRWPAGEAPGGDYSIRALGKALLTAHVLPFEIISVVLLVAILGALAVSMKENSQ